MIIDLSPILRGETSTLQIEYEMSETPDVPDVTFTEGCKVSGKVDNRAGYMTLSLHASLPYVSSCARCLEEVSGVFEASIDQPLAVAGALNDEDTDEYILIENNSIDCDVPINEAVILDFPLRILCKEDCEGLCSMCGKNLNHEKCSCEKKEIDPRLEILAKLLDK